MSGLVRLHRLTGRRVYRLAGAESRDLLQRISTADVTPLAEGQSVATLLTNEKGRVVDLVGVIPEAGGSLLMAGIGDSDGRIASWLNRFIIMEDVNVHDVSAAFTPVALYSIGPDAEWVLPHADRIPVAPVATGRHRWGLAIIAPKNLPEPISEVDESRFTFDRIAAGVPWFPGEIGERRHPLEARLRTLISFTKGCYIGQEVIARLDAYRKVQMALTRFEGTIASGEEVPFMLNAQDGAEVGVVTSIDAAHTGICALGFLKMEAFKTAEKLRSPNGAELRPIDTDTDADIYV